MSGWPRRLRGGCRRRRCLQCDDIIYFFRECRIKVYIVSLAVGLLVGLIYGILNGRQSARTLPRQQMLDCRGMGFLCNGLEFILKYLEHFRNAKFARQGSESLGIVHVMQ